LPIVLEIADLGPELPAVARTAIRHFIETGQRLRVERPGAPARPVFVTLRNPDQSLRGCIGSVSAVESDVVAETARSAVLAASRDPRFPPVSADELPGLSVEVSVLMAPEPVSDVSELDPRRYGVIVRDRLGRQALLLPDIPGVDSPATQIAIARQKAGVPGGAPVTVLRFEVAKFSATLSPAWALAPSEASERSE
jgi:AmmeMemoRadiSam system protein A